MAMVSSIRMIAIYPNISYFLWGYTPLASIFILKKDIFNRIKYPKVNIDLVDV